ncbi:flagellar biosynthesis protein FlgA [Micromonospora cathayae]|uniref:Flagellar biosynthesis protein FlgA n=1 Tax=Micromonospora cathayae TaxID=3028804 RepID=A0ABY7ZUY7_9ACTN|nr:flagellar biosynthesis protein FlgA [Micromonospora sp. HUAS 3]WDZ86683.1 flagellar biosynthesis protein FlgA [Micromonospora sp. HUAS 3]
MRWPGRPGGGTMLRLGLVTVLLGSAAVLLYAPPGCAPPIGKPTGAPGGSAGSPGMSTRTPDQPAGRSPGAPGRSVDPPGPASGVPGRPVPSGSVPHPAGRPGDDPTTGRQDTGTPDTGRREPALDPGTPDGTGPGDPTTGSPALPLPDGTVGVPVRLAEPVALAFVRPGSRVDLLAVPAGTASTAVLVAPRALVLAVIGAGELDGSAALYLALSPPHAQRAVALPEGSRFTVLVRG